MEFSRHTIQRFFTGLPNWIIAALFWIPLSFLLAGISLGHSYDVSNVRPFLSGLGRTQAGVLAIIFSVTILGIQLVASRYSPRLISLFVRAPIFLFTFAIFVFSTAFDFWLLYNLPSNATPLFIGGTYMAGGFSIVAVLSLYEFLRTIPKRMTPEGIIIAFASNLLPSEYRRRVEEAMPNDSTEVSPLHPLYSLVMSALAEDEWVTAERGVNYIHTISEDTIWQLSADGSLTYPANRFSREAFNPVLRGYLPVIATRAFNEDENELVSHAIRSLSEIGQTGVEVYRSYVAEQAARGLTNTIREAPPTTEGNTIRRPAFRQLGELLKVVSEQPNPRTLWRILSTADHQMNVLFRKDADRYVYGNVLVRYFTDLKAVQETLLGHYGGYLGETDGNWSNQFPSSQRENRELFRAFFEWREALVNVTESVIWYLNEHEEYPVASGNFFEVWRNCCIEAASSPAKDYAVVLCSIAIEFAFETYLADEGEVRGWITVLARVKSKSDREVVDRAFEHLHENGRSQLVQISTSTQEPDESAWSGFTKLFTDSETDFQSWLGEFQDAVDDTYQSCQDS
jgi:hypothetical protein